MILLMAKKTKPGPKMISWRATSQDRELIAALSAKMGVNASNIVRLALRELAERQRLKVA